MEILVSEHNHHLLRKFKFISIGLVTILLTLGLVACSSDPYENAGDCEDLGATRVIKGQVQVCIGIENNYKWYISGKYFDDYKLLSKVVYSSNGTDLSWPEIEELGLFDYAFQYEKMKVLSADIAKYAEGDTRWDGLIEAIANMDREQSVQDYLLDERFSTNLQWRQGKLSQQKAYEAQQAQIEHLNGALDKAQNIFQQKLAVLEADIGNKYGITDRKQAVIFGLTILKYAKK
jgi:hypothetical protein